MEVRLSLEARDGILIKKFYSFQKKTTIRSTLNFVNLLMQKAKIGHFFNVGNSRHAKQSAFFKIQNEQFLAKIYLFVYIEAMDVDCHFC